MARLQLRLSMFAGGLCTAAACSSFSGSDAAGPGGADAAVPSGEGGASAVDGGPAPAQKCAQANDFLPPTELDVTGADVSGKPPSRSSPRLTADELTMYFTAPTADARFQTYVATRTSLTAPFGMASAVSSIDSGDAGALNAIASEAWVSGDDGAILFASSRAGGKTLFTATRPGPGAPFGPAQQLFSPTPPAFYQAPYVVPSLQAVYYVSQMSVADGTVRLAVRGSNGLGPEQPVLLAGAQSVMGQNQNAPVLSADGATLYFAAGDATSGQHIYVAARIGASSLSEFGAPTAVTSLGTADDDGPGWLSSDGCRLYFTRSTAGATRLFVAAHPSPH